MRSGGAALKLYGAADYLFFCLQLSAYSLPKVSLRQGCGLLNAFFVTPSGSTI